MFLTGSALTMRSIYVSFIDVKPFSAEESGAVPDLLVFLSRVNRFMGFKTLNIGLVILIVTKIAFMQIYKRSNIAF